MTPPCVVEEGKSDMALSFEATLAERRGDFARAAQINAGILSRRAADRRRRAALAAMAEADGSDIMAGADLTGPEAVAAVREARTEMAAAAVIDGAKRAAAAHATAAHCSTPDFDPDRFRL